jgi:hypothetical protein
MTAVMLAGLLLAFSPTVALATDVRLVNYAAYTYMSNTANLRTDGVQNFDATSQSDPLRLELWAFSSPYVVGMSGLRLAIFALPALDPGSQTGQIDSGTVPFTRPPDGVWYFAMLLTEFTGTSPANDGYVARYAIDFPTPEYIGVPLPPNQFGSIEFYHLGFDHYFVAATAQDIVDLDTGVHPGWTRTGYGFNVWDGPGAGVVAVCRYYIPPGSGDSHFFSASEYECGVAPTMFPLILKESDLAFTIALPDPDTGACASTDIPVYRLWNGRYDSNHRYTTSTTVKALMLAKGYVAEGYGPDQVAMCAPQ